MRQSYTEESFAAKELQKIFANIKIEENGKSNAFSQDIQIIHPNGRRENVEVKSMRFRSAEQSLLFEGEKYSSYNGENVGKYTQKILDFMNRERIEVKDKGIKLSIDLETAKGYLKEQLLRRGSDKVIFSDSAKKKIAIFDLHDPNYIPDIESCSFTLRRKPSGTHPLAFDNPLVKKSIEVLKETFPHCQFSSKEKRTFVHIENSKSKKIEILPDVIASLKDGGIYEIRKRGKASVINLTPSINMNPRILEDGLRN